MGKQIYIPEDTQEMPWPTTLIVKARYQGHPAQYFRADLQGSDGNLIPLLRNYRYKVNIVDIAGAGYASALEAAEAPPALNTHIEADELDIREYVVNDQYILGVSTSRVDFEAGESSFDFKLHTTYSRWSVAWTTQPPEWVKVIDHAGNTLGNMPLSWPAEVTSLQIKTTETNRTGYSRSATIRLTAGLLSKDIYITQQSELN
jgi:hypothetical protein